MSRFSRTSLFALAATAAIAVSALTTTSASAWGHFGGGFHGGFRGGFHGFGGYRGFHGYGGYRGFHFGFRPGPILSHYPYRFGHWGYGRYHWGFGGYRWWNPRVGVGCWRFGWCYPHPRPIIGGPGYGVGVGALAATAAPMAAPLAAPVQQPVAQQPNCLVKQYLPNGAVQFADVCTQEQAIAMPQGAPNLPMQPGQPGPQ